MATIADLERAREWWVRQMGFVSPADDRKLESLAEEFAAAGVAALMASTKHRPPPAGDPDLSVLPVPGWAIDEAKQKTEGLTHRGGAWHSQPPPAPPVVHTGPAPDPVEEVVQALYGWFYRCDCKPSIFGAAVGRGPEIGKRAICHTDECQAKRGAAMQVFAEALGRLRGPGDGLVCRCVFDRECPIHGDQA
jgi:hypothetical protein